MYPQITIGSLHVASFSVMLALAFVVGSLVGAGHLRFLKVDPIFVWKLAPWAAVAGLVGAQLYSVIINLVWGGMDLATALATRGQVFYGGLFAGVLAALWRFQKAGLPRVWLFDYGVSCIAFAHVVGRIGCFLVGDDYGVPTTAPWGVAFPQGAPPSTAGYLRSRGVDIASDISASTVMSVHPVQLYEASVLLVLGVVLWRAARRPHRPYAVLAMYALGYGSWRFFIEFWRPKNDHLLVGLTSAQLISLGLVLVGLATLVQGRRAHPSIPTA